MSPLGEWWEGKDLLLFSFLSAGKLRPKQIQALGQTWGQAAGLNVGVLTSPLRVLYCYSLPHPPGPLIPVRFPQDTLGTKVSSLAVRTLLVDTVWPHAGRQQFYCLLSAVG